MGLYEFKMQKLLIPACSELWKISFLIPIDDRLILYFQIDSLSDEFPTDSVFNMPHFNIPQNVQKVVEIFYHKYGQTERSIDFTKCLILALKDGYIFSDSSLDEIIFKLLKIIRPKLLKHKIYRIQDVGYEGIQLISTMKEIFY